MKKILFGLYLIASAQACRDQVPDDRCSCAPDLVCTLEFRFISIKVSDSAGNPFLLDSVATTRKRTNQVIATLADTPASFQPGFYTVVSDNNSDSIDVCGEEVLFIGYLKGQRVVEELYNLRFNCCHVEKLDGAVQVVAGY